MNNEKEKTLENKYTGETAENYLSFRVSEPHWDKEQKIVWEMLKTMDLEKGSTVVDVPVGTGRFLKYYHDIELDCLGYDISNDMLEKAQDEVTHFSYESIKLSKADIRELPLSDDQAQLVVCIRYMQHVSFEEFKVVLREYTEYPLITYCWECI